MKATVYINPDDTGTKIPERLFGHFIENIGRSIYGGGLLDPEGEVRLEIKQALGGLNAPVIRWPGGLFADGYHWRDGIGAGRAVKPNKYWKRFGPFLGPTDPNLFGADEFLSLCESINAEPYINVNVGSGTPDEAASWVEYCNGATDSYWGARRAGNGRNSPWNVRLWGIGNELYSPIAIGWCSPEKYARRFLAFHETMNRTDHPLQLVAVGSSDPHSDWNRRMLTMIAGKAAMLSVHIYLPGDRFSRLLWSPAATRKNYYALASAWLELGGRLDRIFKQLKSISGEDNYPLIAVDEWNIRSWWRQLFRAEWRMADAIALAGMAGALLDRCERIGMANISQLVNVLGLLQTDSHRVVRTANFYALKMFARTCRGFRLPCNVDSPRYSSKKLGGISPVDNAPFLSAHAALEGDRVGIILIQRSYETGMTVEIRTPGMALEKIQVLHAPSPEAKNTFSNPDVVRIKTSEVKDGHGGMVQFVPPASVVAVTGRLLNEKPASSVD